MPSYKYCCTSCGDEFTEIRKMDERDLPTKSACKVCGEQTIERPVSAPNFIYNPSGMIKTTDSFNDRLIEIKKTKGRDNTINTRRSVV